MHLFKQGQMESRARAHTHAQSHSVELCKNVRTHSLVGGYVHIIT